jgi:hypothetical protein
LDKRNSQTDLSLIISSLMVISLELPDCLIFCMKKKLAEQ